MGRSLPGGGDGWGKFLEGHVPMEERRAVGELVEDTRGHCGWKRVNIEGFKMCMSMGQWLLGALEARASTQASHTGGGMR